VIVNCQINSGDGIGGHPANLTCDSVTVPDQIVNGSILSGWVADWYTNTPAQGADGFSPGISHCSGGGPSPGSAQPLQVAMQIPDVPLGRLDVYGYAAGSLFKDGPGFNNADTVETLDEAEGDGYCQDLVFANTDFSFLWADIKRRGCSMTAATSGA
jgi:hypothetical protein